jgi:hypothetical protein
MALSDLLSPSLEFEAKRIAHYLYWLLPRMCIWNWGISEVPIHANSCNSMLYIGRRYHKFLAMLYLGMAHNPNEKTVEGINNAKDRVVVTEFPFPDAICVPHLLSMVLPLDRPLDELLENIGRDKLLFFRKYRDNYRVKRILDDAEIDRIDKTMLRAFATYRFQKKARHLKYSKIRKMAHKTGALNLVYLNDHEVACKLCAEFSRNGKRYWGAERAGFPEEVFTNRKSHQQVNRMAYFLEIEWASLHGYDFYGLGHSFARPKDGVLQFKRSFRGHLDTMDNYCYFYVRPPKNTSEFFWEAPLFGLEKGKITLNLGKPADKSDEEFIEHFQEMGFGGLSTIYLHCEQPPSQEILSALSSLYDRFENRPNIHIRYQEGPVRSPSSVPV